MRMDFLKKELEEKQVIFLNDYNRIERRRITCIGANGNGQFVKITVKNVRFAKVRLNLTRTIIYCKKGFEREAFNRYMERIPERIKEYLESVPNSVRGTRIRYIKKYFNLN